MPIQSCDPAAHGVLFFTDQYAIDNGNVVVTTNWDWDGTSTWPDCDGPVSSIRVQNNSQLTYYANLPNKKRGVRNIPIPPGTDQTVSGNQLRQAGLETYADAQGLQIYAEPLTLK